MMKAVFEKISKYADTDLPLPVRATKGAAGYDFVVAEDIVVPSFWGYFADWTDECAVVDGAFGLEVVAATMKEMGTKPTLVPTGIKCKLNDGYYLELSVRSSTPLKHWLVLANGVGIIDQDYYGNPDNEGHIFIALWNRGKEPMELAAGERLAQGVFMKYLTVDGDAAGAGKDRQGGFGSTGK
jgi:dUTP pyrophosphatase